MANPFENIFTNLFRNSIFAPPRAVQGAERAAALEAEALQQQQALSLAKRQSLMRGLQGVAEITSPGTLQRPEVINQVLSNPQLMNDLIVKGGLEKPEDFLKVFEGLTAEPFKQTGVSPGEELYAPSPLGYPELIRRNPTTEQADTQDKQKQAAARAEGIGMLSQWLGKGLSRQQVYEKAIGNKGFIKKYIEEGLGKEDGLKTLLELGTPNPLEPTQRSPGVETLLPNAEGTGYTSGGRTPTTEEQRYVEIETRFGPDVAKELFRIAGPTMNLTEKQSATQAILKANPGNRQLEQTLLKIQAGVLQTSTYYDPVRQRTFNTVIDLSKQEAPQGPVATGTSVPPPDQKGDLGVVSPQGVATPHSPYLPQFTPPKPLPPDMTMPAGEAAFELGPAGAVSDVLNNVLAPVGLAKTREKRHDAVAAFNTLADVSREYFQNSGRPLAADVQLVVSRLPKTGGFTKGFFETPLKALSQIKAIRGQIEKDMLYFGGVLSRPQNYNDAMTAEAQESFTRGENAIQYFPTKEELETYIERARKAEDAGPSGIGKEMMKRWEESFQGEQEIRDFLGGEDTKKESLAEKEQRLMRELEALDPPDDQDDPSEMELDDQGGEELPFEPGKSDTDIFSPSPVNREKELIDELMKLEQQGFQAVPLGDGQFVEPAGEQTVTGADGEPVSIEQRKQEIMEELGVLADQKALHRRRLFTEISSVRAAKQTGLPEEVFHAAAGVQSEIAEMTALPAAAVRQALVAIGAARLMNPEWQGERSTESLMKDYWQARGNVVDIPEGSMSGKIGEGAFIGATLAYGLTVAGSRIAAAKGPKALKFAKDRIRKLFAGSKGEATAAGATAGAASNAAGEQARRSGFSEGGQAAVEIGTGLLTPGVGTIQTLGRGGKAITRALTKKTPQPLRSEGPGAELVQQYGKQMASAVANKAKTQKGVLASFTAMDPDRAIGAIFSGPNPEVAMRQIIAVTRQSKDAREGLQRGSLDWLFKATGLKSPGFTPAKFEQVWTDPAVNRAMRLVLPQATTKRIDAMLEAEKKLSSGRILKQLRPSKKVMAAEGISTAATGLPGLVFAANFLAKVGGSTLIKKAGGNTLIAQSAGAQAARGGVSRLLAKLTVSPDALLREAMLDPKFERTLIDRLMALEAKEAAAGYKRGSRAIGGIIGAEGALDEQ